MAYQGKRQSEPALIEELSDEDLEAVVGGAPDKSRCNQPHKNCPPAS